MKKLTDAVKQMLNGLAFEHAGEYLSMQQKTQILKQGLGAINNDYVTAEVHEPPKAPASGNVRRVALYIGSELPSEVMDYVIQTCSHLKHELTVLSFQARNTAEALLKPYQEALEAAGVEIELVTLKGDPVSGLGRYLRSHPEFAFLACKDSGYLGRIYIRGMQGKNALPVPVVVVTTAGEATGTQEQAARSDDDSDAVVA